MRDFPQEAAREAACRFAQATIKGKFKSEALHAYRDADGHPVYFRWRARKDNGEKVIRPMYWNGSAYVSGEPPGPASGKLLYRLPELNAAPATDMVVIVEGEACADALHGLGIVATTSGSASSANSADWSPLSGRQCLIWPDNDGPGVKYADDVTSKLNALGCTVSRIDVGTLGLRTKGDAVDWLQDFPNASAADVLALPNVPRIDRMPRLVPNVTLIRGCDVEIEEIDWLWEGWLAAGKLHLVGGSPGTGKTTIAADLAATITRGGQWPDGTRAQIGDVVFWSGEDDIKDTLAPRLRAAGADMSRVFLIGDVEQGEERYPFDPANDMEALRSALGGIPNLRLIVVDPIVSAITGDSHKNAEVRRGLQPLVDLGSQLRVAILGITHLSKGTAGRDPVERITGSLAFAALARIVMLTGRRELATEERSQGLLLRAKSNIGPDGGGFAYDLQQRNLQGFTGISASSITWGPPLEGAAKALLAAAEQTNDENNPAVDAMAWLRDLLTEGPIQAKEIRRHAEDAGFAWRTVQRAMRNLRVESRRDGFGLAATWKLPPIATTRAVTPLTPAKFSGANGNTGATDTYHWCPEDSRQS